MIVLDLDPNVVQPGWTPLIITVLLGVAIVLLFFSMRRQFRKINIPPTETEAEETDRSRSNPDPGSGRAFDRLAQLSALDGH